MSFGWSVGDIINAAELLLKVTRALNDAEGARNQFQQTASLLKPIQFQLRQLAGIIREHEAKEAIGVERHYPEGLAENDLDTLQGLLVRLKTLVAKLEDALEEGTRMRLKDPKTKSLREWPGEQLNKLKWSFVKDKKVQALIAEILRLTELLPSFYQKIDAQFAKQQAKLQAVSFEHQSAMLQTIDQRLERIEYILSLNAAQEGSLLCIGPEEGIAPQDTSSLGLAEGSSIVPTLRDSLANLDMVSYNVMTPSVSRRVATLKTDSTIRNKIDSWLEGSSPAILWLAGKEAATVSAVLANVAQDRGRPCAAVSIRRSCDGRGDLLAEQRLYVLLYSILYQLLQEIGSSPLVTSHKANQSHALGASMESMPHVLGYISDILSLVPQFVVIVDAWQLV